MKRVTSNILIFVSVIMILISILFILIPGLHIYTSYSRIYHPPESLTNMSPLTLIMPVIALLVPIWIIFGVLLFVAIKRRE